MSIAIQIRKFLFYFGLYNKCPVCKSKVYERYKKEPFFDLYRCSKCDWGNK